MIIFSDVEHENRYNRLLERMSSSDVYHSAMAYLLTLDSVVYRHVSDIFNLRTDSINLDCFTAGWQTSTSLKTIALAFNLWNGFSCDVSEVFDCGDYAIYYFEAVKLRFSLGGGEGE